RRAGVLAFGLALRTDGTGATGDRRRRRRRRGHGGPLRAVPLPRRPGVLRARARSRQWGRWHLVLEPVSGRALRRSEPRVLVRVLQRARRRVAVVRDLPAPA